MDYFERTKRELTSLLELIRSERADFEGLAKTERAALDALVGHRLEAERTALATERRMLEGRLQIEREQAESKLMASQDALAVDRRLFKREQQRAGKERTEEAQRLHRELTEQAQRVQDDQAALLALVQEKTQGFPWLATAYADYERLMDMQLATNLQKKSHPAPVAAQEVREQSRLRRAARKETRVYRYLLEYYETLFPWLVDFKGEELDALLEMSAMPSEPADGQPAPADPVQKWLTPAEYSSLPSAERNQLALDRWWQRPKSRWQVGRDYERYVGYVYERDGYAVLYQGIVEGFDDLGRDLICRNRNETAVVQCKNWSQDKLIHEKHIFQLYGTVIAYRIEAPQVPARGVFYTTTSLSPRARQFAELLGVDVKEHAPLQPYPCIKCNLSRRDGSKIYHLPFDQQYDRTVIEQERNECYADTVADAERLGFRRAHRWMGSHDA